MADGIFPKKDNEFMSDAEWEKYCCDVWCCNSLNAYEGLLRHSLTNAETLFNGLSYVTIREDTIEGLLMEIQKAQAVISYLSERYFKQ